MPNFVVGKSFSIDENSIAQARQSAKLVAFFKFESFPFIEETSLKVLNNDGEQPPVVEKGAFGDGCRFRPQSRFSFPLELKSDSALTIGFWLQPKNILPTVSASDASVVYYRSSLFGKASYSYSSTSGMVSIEEGSFVLYEECRDNNKNVLRIHLVGDDGSEVIVITPEYDCDIFHHFWITYNGLSREVVVFIDGIRKTIAIEDGEVPSTINKSFDISMNFNLSAIGYNALLRTNTGLLDELVIMDQAITDISVISRHINYGTEFAIDETLKWREETYQSFGFDDPTALHINCVYGNGTNIYVGRSDGKIFKGDRIMWESRHNFADEEEDAILTKKLLASDSSITFEEGALKIYKGNIRIN